VVRYFFYADRNKNTYFTKHRQARYYINILKEGIETVLSISPQAKIIVDDKNILSPVKGAVLLASKAAGIWDHFDIH
jgi:hypothetical protein